MNHKRIFVVDDDVVLATMLNDHLSENPLHEVFVYNTGEECLNNLHHNPDVIILDYQLNSVEPTAKDGLAILQEIKQFEQGVCVIMLSSQTQYGKAAQTIIKGALEYVIKDKNAFNAIDKILSNLN